jgi:hypothetical protein
MPTVYHVRPGAPLTIGLRWGLIACANIGVPKRYIFFLPIIGTFAREVERKIFANCSHRPVVWAAVDPPDRPYDAMG